MSGVKYRYEQNLSKISLKDGVKHVTKESIIDGDKGISFRILEKRGDKFYKLYVKQIGKDEFEVSTVKDSEKEEKKVVKKADVLKMIKGDKKLLKVDDYLKKERKQYIKGGAKKKKSTKKKSTKKKSTKKKVVKKKTTKKKK